jgi:hypothetical protein
VVENDLAEQAVDFHHGHLAGDLHPAVTVVNIFAGFELAELLAAGNILRVIAETFCESSGDGDVNFLGRINALGAAAIFDASRRAW